MSQCPSSAPHSQPRTCQQSTWHFFPCWLWGYYGFISLLSNTILREYINSDPPGWVEKPSWERNLWGNATNFKRHLLDKNQMNTVFKNLIWWQNRFVSVIIKTIVTFWCKVMSTGNNQGKSCLGTVKHSKLPWNRIGRDLSFHMRINSLNAVERRQPIPPLPQQAARNKSAGGHNSSHSFLSVCMSMLPSIPAINLFFTCSPIRKKKKKAEFPQRFYDFRNHFKFYI